MWVASEPPGSRHPLSRGDCCHVCLTDLGLPLSTVKDSGIESSHPQHSDSCLPKLRACKIEQRGSDTPFQVTSLRPRLPRSLTHSLTHPRLVYEAPMTNTVCVSNQASPPSAPRDPATADVIASCRDVTHSHCHHEKHTPCASAASTYKRPVSPLSTPPRHPCPEVASVNSLLSKPPK